MFDSIIDILKETVKETPKGTLVVVIVAMGLTALVKVENT